MPATSTMTPQQTREFRRLAEALMACRPAVQAAASPSLYENCMPGSPRHQDLAVPETGPAGPWDDKVTQRAENMALNLARQAANHVAAMGALYASDEVYDAPDVVARAAFEFATRSYWLLDLTITHRQRFARYAQHELLTLHFATETAKALHPSWENSAERTAMRAQRREHQRLFDGMLQTVKTDVTTGRIYEGQGPLMFGEIARHFAAAEQLGVDGLGLYGALSMRAHPQGFTRFNGRFEVQADGHAARTLSLEELQELARFACGALYAAARNVEKYHGHDTGQLRTWAQTVEEVLPGTFIIP